MKNLDVKAIRKAAKIVANEREFCCIALGKVAGRKYVQAFEEIFKPSWNEMIEVYGSNALGSAFMGDLFDDSSKIDRSLALLFLEQIVEDEQK